jgi:hypothetical protein
MIGLLAHPLALVILSQSPIELTYGRGGGVGRGAKYNVVSILRFNGSLKLALSTSQDF